LSEQRTNDTAQSPFVDLDIALFIAVVERDGIQNAARALDLPRSTVSKRLSRLEKRLGVGLLNRNSRTLSLTPVGRIYFEHGKRALSCLSEAENAVQALKNEPSGTLRVSCAVMIGINAIVPRLPEFHRAYPKIRLDLSLSDKFEDLVASGFDMAIRFGTMSDSSLIARKVMSARRIVCASPRYLESYGVPEKPDDLNQHNCLNLSTLGQMTNFWTFQDGDRVRHLEVRGNFTTDSGAAHYAAILAGVGIGRVTQLRAMPDLEEGRMVRLLEAHDLASPTPIYAVMPGNRNVIPAVRAFMNFVSQIEN